MYAQSHVVHRTQECDQKEGLHEEINSCTAMLNITKQ